MASERYTAGTWKQNQHLFALKYHAANCDVPAADPQTSQTSKPWGKPRCRGSPLLTKPLCHEFTLDVAAASREEADAGWEHCWCAAQQKVRGCRCSAASWDQMVCVGCLQGSVFAETKAVCVASFTDTSQLCPCFELLPEPVLSPKPGCKCCLLATTTSSLAFAGGLTTCFTVVAPLTRSSGASLTKPGLVYPSSTASGPLPPYGFYRLLQALSTSPRTSIHFLQYSLGNHLFMRACWQYFTP